jgi:hypothetical protein
MRLCSTLSPSADAPDELIAASHMAQTCLECMTGSAVAGAAAASRPADATPQKLSPASFDALVRENKGLIERVPRPRAVLLLFRLNLF